MEPPNGDGPDGSSIKPVSALRARFENSNAAAGSTASSTKPVDIPASATPATTTSTTTTTTTTAATTAVPTTTSNPSSRAPTPARAVSPAPKPERLRDFKPVHGAATTTPSAPSTPVVPARPKEKPKIPAPLRGPSDEQDAPPPVPPVSTRPWPVVKPQGFVPQHQQQQESAPPPLPAVTVQPPQSPPKSGGLSLGTLDSSPLLNPDGVTTPVTPGGSPRSFKIPKRPHTPSASVNLPRSPRLGGSQPPSPPPPRRSAELRREPKIPPPPPAPRGEKALIPASKSTGSVTTPATPMAQRGDISQETSPFNSPPDSVGSGEGTPPKLPSRPRPQLFAEGPSRPSHTEGASRPRSVIVGGFDTPPVHHAVANMRKDRDNEAHGPPFPGRIVPQLTGEARPTIPALPARPAAPEVPSRPLISSNNSMKPPPRPPRGVSPSAQPADSSMAPPPPKRVSSTPVSQQAQQPQQAQQAQQLIPPTRGHGRSMTVDRTSDRTPAEFRISSASAVSTPTAAAPHPSISSKVIPAKTETVSHITTYPDASNTNRRPPFIKHNSIEISTKYDAKIFDVCGEFIVASGQMTRVWSLVEGEQIMSLAHTEGIKATAVAFKPAADPREEGKKLWIGTNTGDLMEVDIATHAITPSKPNIHGRYEVTKIYRHFNEIWTLDEAGTLLVWGPDSDSVANVTGNPTQSYKVPKAHTFSIVIGDTLWHATGKEIRVFEPSTDGRAQFQVLVRALYNENVGEVTSGTLLKSQPGKVIFGHLDGKISMYSTTDYTCLGIMNISTWKINALANAGPYVWVGYNSGNICVYDIDGAPWILKKEWQAHGTHGSPSPVIKMVTDPASAYFLDRLQLVSLGADNKIKVWDGLLQDDYLEDSMKSKDTEYCTFDELKALFLTWNAGASTPSSLRSSDSDATFFQELVQSSGSPDILVFGFQELVDLEDKKLTAKRFLKVKKKKEEGTDQERMSHQYRDWRDFLMKTLDDYMPADDLYHLLHTAPMVGLFTCVFAKTSLRDRVRNLHGAEVKRGMGGLHGNKGGVAVRFRIDDTSLCFVNCHLAAGQSQANARHTDIAAILEANLFPTERDPDTRIDAYAGGGDGSVILDHELCIVNGDLNYRIDTMSRDTVVTAVKQNNLGKLLERDQLLVARRRNPAFKLRAFDEMPITFAPTYKYDVGTDTYDTSEKRRSPAWCDRLLYRGRGRIQQLDYQRHEVRVSDHRPVTGTFNLWVKKVDPRLRTVAWMESQKTYEDFRQQQTGEDRLLFLTDTCGFDAETSKRLAKEAVSG